MGGKEKVPRPARVIRSSQEANKKRVAKAAGVRTGKRNQTKCAKAERATFLQEKEERLKRTINIILDEGPKKVNGKGGFTASKISDDLLVPDKNATENPELLSFLRGTLGPEIPVAPFTRTHSNPEADLWRKQ